MGLKVLVVDDAMFMRTLLKGILTEGGFEVIGEASNGKEAIKKYDELKPDVVTMDITMPDMDGLEALKKIREKYSDAKVVMCTAMGQKDLVLQAIQNGAVNFIVKPFEKDMVIETLKKVS